jgi:hypothetical protein
MLRLLHGTNYDFIKWWKHMVVLTLVWMAIGAAMIVQRKIRASNSPVAR